MSDPKILIFDLETIAQPFTTGADHTGRTKIRAEHCAVVCMGYKWGLEGKTHCLSSNDNPKEFAKDPFNDKKLLKEAAELIMEADFIVAHYGSGFDKPMLQTRFFLSGLDDAGIRIGQMKVIDTCIMARKLLKVSSSSLRYISDLLGLGQKGQPGKECWTGVMRSDVKSIKQMITYCKKDVDILAKMYEWMRGKYPNHPNLNHDKKDSCPTCLSNWWRVCLKKPMLKGKALFQRRQCRKCGHEFQGHKIKTEK